MIKFTIHEPINTVILLNLAIGTYFKLLHSDEVYRVINGEYKDSTREILEMNSANVIRVSTLTKVIILEGSGEIIFSPK